MTMRQFEENRFCFTTIATTSLHQILYNFNYNTTRQPFKRNTKSDRSTSIPQIIGYPHSD